MFPPSALLSVLLAAAAITSALPFAPSGRSGRVVRQAPDADINSNDGDDHDDKDTNDDEAADDTSKLFQARVQSIMTERFEAGELSADQVGKLLAAIDYFKWLAADTVQKELGLEHRPDSENLMVIKLVTLPHPKAM